MYIYYNVAPTSVPTNSLFLEIIFLLGTKTAITTQSQLYRLPKTFLKSSPIRYYPVVVFHTDLTNLPTRNCSSSNNYSATLFSFVIKKALFKVFIQDEFRNFNFQIINAHCSHLDQITDKSFNSVIFTVHISISRASFRQCCKEAHFYKVFAAWRSLQFDCVCWGSDLCL